MKIGLWSHHKIKENPKQTKVSIAPHITIKHDAQAGKRNRERDPSFLTSLFIDSLFSISRLSTCGKKKQDNMGQHHMQLINQQGGGSGFNIQPRATSSNKNKKNKQTKKSKIKTKVKYFSTSSLQRFYFQMLESKKSLLL